MSTQYTRNLDWSVLLQGNYFEVYFLRIYLILQLYKQQIFFVANYVLALLFIFFFFTIALSIYPSFHFVVLLLPDIFFSFFFHAFWCLFMGHLQKLSFWLAYIYVILYYVLFAILYLIPIVISGLGVNDQMFTMFICSHLHRNYICVVFFFGGRGGIPTA